MWYTRVIDKIMIWFCGKDNDFQKFETK